MSGGLTIESVQAAAEAARQFSMQMILVNINESKRAVELDTYTKIVNNQLNKPGKVDAVQ